MPVQYIARVTCDNPGCTSTEDLGVNATVDSSGSGWSGCDCKAELEPDTYIDASLRYDDRWSDFGDGRIWCPVCVRGEGPVLK